jgi:hypothetical protein
MGAPVLNAAITDVSDSGGLEIGRKLFQDFLGFLLTPLQISVESST